MNKTKKSIKESVKYIKILAHISCLWLNHKKFMWAKIYYFKKMNNNDSCYPNNNHQACYPGRNWTIIGHEWFYLKFNTNLKLKNF